MSGSQAPHLQRRNGLYHLRLRVPDDLKLRMGMLEVRRSLRTYKPAEARLLAATYVARVMGVFEMVRANEISKERVRLLVQACFRELRIESEKGITFETDRPDEEAAEQRMYSHEFIARLGDGVRAQSHGTDVRRLAQAALDRVGIGLSELPPHEQLDVCDGIARALIESERIFVHRMSDRLTPYRHADPLFLTADTLTDAEGCPEDDRPRHGSNGAPFTFSPALDTIGPTVGFVIARYLAAHKQSWTPKTHASRVRHLRFLVEHLGADRSISSVNEADIRGYRDAISRFRRNHGRLGALSLSEKQTDSDAHRISPKTATLIFEPCKAFFRWAKSAEGYISSNPAEDIRILLPKQMKGKKTRRPFEADELEQLFSSPFFAGHFSRHRRYVPGSTVTKDSKFWIPVVGFYTGARLGEIVQLHVGDVHLDDGVPYISICEEGGGSSQSETKHVKSAAGIRKVPIHPDLLTLGFGEFVQRRRKVNKGSKRLFADISFGSDGQASTVFSKLFGRVMNAAHLDDPGLVFHSFRHNAEDALRNALQPQYVIDRIIGHSDGATSSLYGQGVSLEVAYEAVCAMKLLYRMPTANACN